MNKAKSTSALLAMGAAALLSFAPMASAHMVHCHNMKDCQSADCKKSTLMTMKECKKAGGTVIKKHHKNCHCHGHKKHHHKGKSSSMMQHGATMSSDKMSKDPMESNTQNNS